MSAIGIAPGRAIGVPLVDSLGAAAQPKTADRMEHFHGALLGAGDNEY
jgi:hypothetical protein